MTWSSAANHLDLSYPSTSTAARPPARAWATNSDRAEPDGSDPSFF